MQLSIADRIRKTGQRATTSRILMLTYLTEAKVLLSVQDIAAALRKKIDVVTVYRMIDSFKKSGLVRQVDLGRGRPLYEIDDPHDHHHVVCTKCDRVEDFEGCDYKELAETALQQVRVFARIESHSFELFGICNKCNI